MPSKLSPRIRRFLLEAKRKQYKLSCRKACILVERKFLVKLSKSRVNLLWKENSLSQPVGRVSTKKPPPQSQIQNVGFAFLIAADTQLQLTVTLAESLRSVFPKIPVSYLQKALYSLIYRKLFPDSEFWTISRHNILLNKLLSIENRLDDCDEELVTFLNEAGNLQQEIVGIHFMKQDKARLTLDGQMRSLCLGSTPEALARPLSVVDKELGDVFLRHRPLILFAMPGFSLYGAEITELFESFQGEDPEKSITNINLVDAKGKIKDCLSDLPVARHSIIFGLWPWQYQIPGNVKPKGGYRYLWFGPTSTEFSVGESELSISQHTSNKELTIRLIHIKHRKTGFPMLSLGTNIPKNEAKTKEIALLYLNRWPYIENSFEEYLKLQKQKLPIFALEPDFQKPGLPYLLDFIVAILSAYVQKHLFSSEKIGQDFASLRQKLYNLSGKTTYSKKNLFIELGIPSEVDYAEDVVLACRRVNEANCRIAGDIKIWLSSRKK